MRHQHSFMGFVCIVALPCLAAAAGCAATTPAVPELALEGGEFEPGASSPVEMLLGAGEPSVGGESSLEANDEGPRRDGAVSSERSADEAAATQALPSGETSEMFATTATLSPSTFVAYSVDHQRRWHMRDWADRWTVTHTARSTLIEAHYRSRWPPPTLVDAFSLESSSESSFTITRQGPQDDATTFVVDAGHVTEDADGALGNDWNLLGLTRAMVEDTTMFVGVGAATHRRLDAQRDLYRCLKFFTTNPRVGQAIPPAIVATCVRAARATNYLL